MNEKSVRIGSKGYLAALGSALLGLTALSGLQLVSLPDGFIISSVALGLFIIVNVVTAHVGGLWKELGLFWSVRKLIFFFYGTIGGLLIVAVPTGLALLSGNGTQNGIILQTNFSVPAMGLTLIIVAWEELWFRGIYLNYSRRYIPEVKLAAAVGVLFMLLHVLNPKIDIVHAGPTLLFAGALLTLLYFRYRTIWVPLGVHFGNNLFGSIFKVGQSSDLFWGSDGYTTALLLCGIFLFYALKYRGQEVLIEAEFAE